MTHQPTNNRPARPELEREKESLGALDRAARPYFVTAISKHVCLCYGRKPSRAFLIKSVIPEAPNCRLFEICAEPGDIPTRLDDLGRFKSRAGAHKRLEEIFAEEESKS